VHETIVAPPYDNVWRDCDMVLVTPDSGVGMAG
jgi:hypothetical protein